MKHFVFSFKPAADGGAAHGPTTTVFCTMNATVYWRFDCSPQYQILSHSSVDAPTIVLLLQSELLYLSTGMSRTTFCVPVVAPFGSLLTVFDPVTHLSPPPWSLTGAGWGVVVHPGLNRSSMSLHRCAFVLFFQWAFESLAAPISSPSLLDLVVRNVVAPHKVSSTWKRLADCGIYIL